MDETFYGMLGVDADADREAIERAYRQRVKDVHPDVSDDPNATQRFKRLTAARDVLVDDRERARYDRLGHAEYVSTRFDGAGWTRPSKSPRGNRREAATQSTTETEESGPTPDQSASATNESGSTARTGAASGQAGTGRTWLGDDDRTVTEAAAGGATRGGRSGGRRATAKSDEEWQHASQAYQRVETEFGGETSAARSVIDGIRAVGGWMVVHVVLIASALATAWLVIARAGSHVQLSVPTLVAGMLVLVAVVALSVLHVVSRVYG